jgi:RNA 2',3'-cyclic 3'-phosphodiesterase
VSEGRSSDPAPKPLRLFVAVDVPEAARPPVRTALEPFTSRIPGARWTAESAWHVTVKFLGGTWPRMLDDVRGAISATAESVPAFETRLTALGVFPGPGRARVVWVGLDDPGGRFAAIASGLDEGLAEHFAPESRAFTPHLTLARLTPPRSLREFAPDLVGAEVGSDPWAVRELVLYRSHLSPLGATYEALERFRLSA